MNFRTKPRLKEMIQGATALSCVDNSILTMSAPYRSALETIAAHERSVLRAVDHAAFFAAIDYPPESTDKLRASFLRHRESIHSK